MHSPITALLNPSSLGMCMHLLSTFYRISYGCLFLSPIVPSHAFKFIFGHWDTCLKDPQAATPLRLKFLSKWTREWIMNNHVWGWLFCASTENRHRHEEIRILECWKPKCSDALKETFRLWISWLYSVESELGLRARGSQCLWASPYESV